MGTEIQMTTEFLSAGLVVPCFPLNCSIHGPKDIAQIILFPLFNLNVGARFQNHQLSSRLP